MIGEANERVGRRDRITGAPQRVDEVRVDAVVAHRHQLVDGGADAVGREFGHVARIDAVVAQGDQFVRREPAMRERVHCDDEWSVDAVIAQLDQVVDAEPAIAVGCERIEEVVARRTVASVVRRLDLVRFGARRNGDWRALQRPERWPR